MDAASDLSFDGICRTCMHVIAENGTFAATTAAQSEVRCYSIFDTVTECGTMRIGELLATTTPQLQVHISDELPQKICRECLHLLQSVYRFQQMCIQSEHQMREILAKRYPDVKLIMPALLSETIAETKEISMVEAEEGEIETVAENNSLEVPLANDPLQNEQFVKMEECFDVDKYKGRGASVAGTNLFDPSLLIEAGTPATAHASQATSDEVSSKEDVDCDWTSDMPTFQARKASKCKKSDITVQKAQINEATSKHSCNHCNKSFSRRRYLTNHLKRHEKWEERKNLPEKPLDTYQRFHFKCDICGHRFYKPESLHKHKQTHTDQPGGEEKKKIYACDLCDNTYCSKQSLGYHKNRRHSEKPFSAPPKPHVCEICNKRFQFRADLVDHLRTHTDEKPFLCSLCGKTFKRTSNLNQHLIRHSGVKGFECPECPKKFACSSYLSKHRVTHRLVKPHNCDICGASFAKSCELKAHKMYHNGDKPHKCEYCDMRFVLMGKKRRHMRTHTGEKPYKCKYCERAFAQSNDLIKHLRSHLGENVYKCELCPSSFRLACELRLHFASHKNDDEETRARNMLALKEEDASLRLNLRANGYMNITNS